MANGFMGVTLKNNQSGQMVFGVVLIIGGLVAGFFGYKEVRDIKSLLENGLRTQATTVRINEFIANKQGQKNTYSPVVQWNTRDGQSIEAKASFGSVRSSDYQVGRPFTVIYDPKKPQKRYYVLKDSTQPKVAFTDYILLIIGVIFSLGGFTMAAKSN